MKHDQRIRNRIIEDIFQRIYQAHEEAETRGRFKVYIFIPLMPSAAAPIEKCGIIRATLHWEYQTINRGKRSLFGMLREKGINPHDYVSVFSLRTHGTSPRTGIPVSEMVYIHSKVMIVDDEWVIIGSANLNDRSQLGNRDSEIAVVIHDTAQFVEIKLAHTGERIRVGKAGYELRMRLLQEHLAIPSANLHLFDDLSDNSVWLRINEIAINNTRIYESVFGCVPSNRVHSFKDLAAYHEKLAQYAAATVGGKQNVPSGHHPVPDCFAPLCTHGSPNREHMLAELSKVRGHIVHFPLDFLKDETASTLLPRIGEKEFLVAAHFFT